MSPSSLFDADRACLCAGLPAIADLGARGELVERIECRVVVAEAALDRHLKSFVSGVVGGAVDVAKDEWAGACEAGLTGLAQMISVRAKRSGRACEPEVYEAIVPNIAYPKIPTS